MELLHQTYSTNRLFGPDYNLRFLDVLDNEDITKDVQFGMYVVFSLSRRHLSGQVNNLLLSKTFTKHL